MELSKAPTRDSVSQVTIQQIQLIYTDPFLPESSSKKAREAEAVFRRIIDAEAQPLSGSKGFNSRAGQNSRRPKAQADAEMDKLDSRFAEMLGDYLKGAFSECAKTQVCQPFDMSDSFSPPLQPAILNLLQISNRS